MAASVAADVPQFGKVLGDVAWGGNWFFLVRDHAMEISLKNVEKLTEFTWAIRQALQQHGITGTGQQEIDHIDSLHHRVCPRPIARILFCVPARPMTVLRAGRAPALNLHAFTPTANYPKDKFGSRRASWAARLKAAL